ncbi:MAG: N-acetylmuramoyl-L-alanine amidase [Anaerolineales bacterium]|nr:N-acetylmuramoyl-L-alanine amidase [Anaerolineales bacterium]
MSARQVSERQQDMQQDYGQRKIRTNSEPPGREVLRHVSVTLIVAAILATIFTAWTPASLSPGEIAGQLVAALDTDPAGPSASVAEPGTSIEDRALRVGIVIGHLGPNPSTGADDPGSICSDGLTELEVNREIGMRTAAALEAAGFEVDVLEEFDDRLFEYRAVALVSIHADSCLPINDLATGYKVASALDTVVPDRAQRLVDCIVDRYARATDMNFHAGSITRDMTEYHSFREIHSQTPAAIIEAGFLYLDRDFLTSNPGKAARGIADGVLCYVNNEPASIP